MEPMAESVISEGGTTTVHGEKVRVFADEIIMSTAIAGMTFCPMSPSGRMYMSCPVADIYTNQAILYPGVRISSAERSHH